MVRGESLIAVRAKAQLGRTEWPWRVPHPVVFWLPRRLVGALTRGAPDFFDWRSDTIEVAELSSVALRPLAVRDWDFGVDPRFSREEQDERLRELQARIAATPDSVHERVCRTRLDWWDELAELKLARGQLDEALRMLTEEVLPVFERLGDLRSLLVCRAKIALTLLARGRADERAQANRLLCLALAAARHLRLPEAGQIEQILQDAGMDCDGAT